MMIGEWIFNFGLTFGLLILVLLNGWYLLNGS